MQADTLNGNARCRCRLTTGECARNEVIDREDLRSAAVSKRRLTAAIDGYLTGLFDADDLPATIESLTAAGSEPDPQIARRRRRAMARLSDCDGKLARHRQAIDSGADPATVAAWSAETNAERPVAERELTSVPDECLDGDAIERLAQAFAASADPFQRTLEATSPEARQRLYDDLLLTARYQPGADHVEISLSPAGAKAVSEGDLYPDPTRFDDRNVRSGGVGRPSDPGQGPWLRPWPGPSWMRSSVRRARVQPSHR